MNNAVDETFLNAELFIAWSARLTDLNNSIIAVGV